jgi:hypothetical protein
MPSVIYEQLRIEAEGLVRQIKDESFEHAVLLLIDQLIADRQRTEKAILDEVEARIARVGVKEPQL